MIRQLFLPLTFSALLLSACGPDLQSQEMQNFDGASDIVGGQEIPLGDARGFYVAKLSVDMGDLTFTCTATHISENVLITAAHCLPTKKTKDMRLYYRTQAGGLQSRLVKQILVHEDYPKFSRSDLALIKIYGLMPSSQKVLPLNFNIPKDELFSVMSIGYGITNLVKMTSKDSKGLGVLRVVESRVSGYSMNRDQFYIDMSKGKGINSGDSGGPGIYLVNGQPTILGIARAVDFRERDKAKIFDSIGYYTALSFHQDWVLKSLNTLEKSF